MFAFFDSFIDIVEALYQFAQTAGAFIVFLFTGLPRALRYIISLVAYAPSFLSFFIMLIVSFVAVLNLLNKGS